MLFFVELHFRDKSTGLNGVNQELNLRKCERTGTHIVAVLCAADAAYIVATFLQIFDTINYRSTVCVELVFCKAIIDVFYCRKVILVSFVMEILQNKKGAVIILHFFLEINLLLH